MTVDEIKRRAEEALGWCGEQIPGRWNVGFLNAVKDDLPWALGIVLALCEWEELNGTPEARHILKSAMRGEGPKVKKVKEHEFENDENDILSCALCGEWRMHYLHGKRTGQ